MLFEVGARPYPPAEVYRAYLAQADVFIGVYWQRYGQLVPGIQVTGLEEEFDLSGGLPRLLYVKVLDRYDDALGHLREADDLGDRFGSTWLTAWLREQLGTLSILRGDLPQARALLEEALDLSVAARSTAAVALCLAAYARLAFAEDDPERSARLEGVAEGLRRPAGLRVWPTLHQSEAELVAQTRQTLGTDRFDQAFSAGSALTQREAVATVRNSAAGFLPPKSR